MLTLLSCMVQQAAALGEAAGYSSLAAVVAQQQQLGSLPPGMVPASALAAQAAMQAQAQAQVGATPSAYAGLRGGHASMPLPDLQHGGYALPAGGYASFAGSIPGAAGRPPTAVRRVQSARDGAYDGAHASLASTSGRVRKIPSYAGSKRKSMGEGSYSGGYTHPALPRHMAAEVARGGSGAVSDSSSWRSGGVGSDDSGSEVSRSSKGSRGGGARGGARGKMQLVLLLQLLYVCSCPKRRPHLCPQARRANALSASTVAATRHRSGAAAHWARARSATPVACATRRACRSTAGPYVTA